MSKAPRFALVALTTVALLATLSGCSASAQQRAEGFTAGIKQVAEKVQDEAYEAQIPPTTEVLGNFDSVEGGYVVLMAPTPVDTKQEAGATNDPKTTYSIPLKAVKLTAEYDHAVVSGTVDEMTITFTHEIPHRDRAGRTWLTPGITTVELQKDRTTSLKQEDLGLPGAWRDKDNYVK